MLTMIKPLNKINKTQLVDTFHLAFSDYTLNMTMPEDYWITRWASARIDYNLSFGYFDENKLCGFVLHGIDEWEGKMSFFNMGTGVIPSHRGQRIVKQIYNAAIPLLKANGIQRGYLEVLQDNDKAIKAYESVGFKIERTLNCFKAYKPENKERYNLSAIIDLDPKKYHSFKNHYLGWEQIDKVIEINPSLFKAYELYDQNESVGFAIIKPGNGQIIQYGVKNDDWYKYAPSLFREIYNLYSNYKIVNVDINDLVLTKFLFDSGFEKSVTQWEMGMEL